MEKITETLTGTLAFGQPDNRLAFLAGRLNEVIKPPREATAENVNIRAMYVVNDQVNSHGGRFRADDLLDLCILIADTPVLVGHNRAGQPLARAFHAEIEVKDGIKWLKSFFYWPKPDGPDEFLNKVDSGVFKECSISFVYTLPECSVCGDDIRRCPHEIESNSPGLDKPHFIYRGVTQILETSLVFKGSVRGTHITDRLIAGGDTIIIRSDERQFELSIPGGLTTEFVNIYPLSNRTREFRIVSIPAGIDSAMAIKNGRPHLMVRLSQG